MASTTATISFVNAENQVLAWSGLNPKLPRTLAAFATKLNASLQLEPERAIFRLSCGLSKPELTKCVYVGVKNWVRHSGGAARALREFHVDAPLAQESAPEPEVPEESAPELDEASREFLAKTRSMYESAFEGASTSQSDVVVLVDHYSHVADELLASAALHRFVCLPLIGPDGYGPELKSGLVPGEPPQESDLVRSRLPAEPRSVLFSAKRVAYRRLPNGRRVRVTQTCVVEAADDYDSGEEMGRYLEGGYSECPQGSLVPTMRSNARASMKRKRKQTTQAARSHERELLLSRLDRLRHLRSHEPLRVHLEPTEASLMTKALRPYAGRVALVIGGPGLQGIARDAGVPASVPMVKSVVDPALVELITGDGGAQSLLTWYSELALRLLRREGVYVPRPRGWDALTWTSQQLISGGVYELDRQDQQRETRAGQMRARR